MWYNVSCEKHNEVYSSQLITLFSPLDRPSASSEEGRIYGFLLSTQVPISGVCNFQLDKSVSMNTIALCTIV